MHSSARVLLLSLLIVGCNTPPSPDDAHVINDDARADASDDARSFDAAPPPTSRPAVAPFSAYVDPFIGTGGVAFRDIGSTHPGPQMPFGMVRPGPDTADENGNLTRNNPNQLEMSLRAVESAPVDVEALKKVSVP